MNDAVLLFEKADNGVAWLTLNRPHVLNAMNMAVRDEMLDIYYRDMGWDRKTGKPLPETLKKLGLDHIIPDMWGS